MAFTNSFCQGRWNDFLIGMARREVHMNAYRNVTSTTRAETYLIMKINCPVGLCAALKYTCINYRCLHAIYEYIGPQQT